MFISEKEWGAFRFQGTPALSGTDYSPKRPTLTGSGQPRGFQQGAFRFQSTPAPSGTDHSPERPTLTGSGQPPGVSAGCGRGGDQADEGDLCTHER